jgi:hypothetical protein
MSRTIRVIRSVLSAPFAIGAMVLMGIAVWIMPKPQRLENPYEPNDPRL